MRFPTISIPPMSVLLTEPIPILTGWVVGGLMSIFMPLIIFNSNKRDYYNSWGYYVEYQQQQDGSNQNNQDNSNNYYLEPCKWFQFSCRRRYYLYRQANEGGGNGDGANQMLPAWYQYMGGVEEEDDRNREEMGLDPAAATGAVKFVYAWTLILFVGMLAYGGFVLYKRQSPVPLMILMLLVAQFCFLQLLLMGQGVLKTDDRDMEDSLYGWYGQFGVFMVYSDFWFFLFGIFFTIVLALKMLWERRQATKKGIVNEEADPAGDYQEAPGDRDWVQAERA